MTADFTCGGELTNENLQVGTSNSIGVSIQGVPSATNEVIDGQVSTCHAPTGIEVGEPGVVRGLHRADVSFTSHGVGCPFDANGDPAVILKVGVYTEEKAVDAVRCARTQNRMVEIRCGVHIRWIDHVTRNRRHEVVFVVHLYIQTGATVAGHVGNTKGAHEHSDVFSHHLCRNLVPLRSRRRQHRSGRKRKTGAGEKQA